MDLFYSLKQDCTFEEKENRIIRLSDLLRERAVSSGNEIDDGFRCPNEIEKRLQNIEYLDTNGECGLADYSDLDERAYKFSRRNRNGFQKQVIDVKNQLNQEYGLISVD